MPLEGFDRDYFQIALDYANRVTSRREVACKWIRLACKRFKNDLKRAKKADCAFIFSEWNACDACAFIECLPHVEGQWDDPNIILTDSWCFIIVNIFGFRQREFPERRRFNTAYIEVARKNAKSAITSGVALYCLTCEGEPGPQVKTAATTGAQARIVFDVCKKMVHKEPELQEEFSLNPMAHSIVCHDNLGTIQPINSKAQTQDGLNPHMIIMDELHATDRDLFDVLKSARGARKNPLSWFITTAGYDVHGVCYEQNKLLRKILEGTFEADHYFGVIYTIDKSDDPFNPKVWHKANPNLGIITQLKEFEEYASEAQETPENQVEFLTKRLNVWCNAYAAWINYEKWKACGGSPNWDEVLNQPCYAGLDLASVQDIAAYVLLWRYNGYLIPKCRFYCPEARIKSRTREGNVPYKTWVNQGLLTATPGNVIDYEFIEKDIREDLDKLDIIEFGYDPWNATDLVNRLVNDGAPMVEFRQGPKSFNAPMKELQRCYLSGMVQHGGNPVLNWMAANLVARKDPNENLAPDKKNSEEKIDGMVALLEALGLMVNEEQQYVESGFVSL